MKSAKRFFDTMENAALRRDDSVRGDPRGDDARGRPDGTVVAASSFTGETGVGRKKRCSMTSHAGVGVAAVGKSGLSWQSTKRGQRFEIGSSRESAQKSMKASSSLTLAISVTFEIGAAGVVGSGGTGVLAESREECRERARREDLRDKGTVGGTVTSTSSSHNVATRSRVPEMVPNP